MFLSQHPKPAPRSYANRTQRTHRVAPMPYLASGEEQARFPLPVAAAAVSPLHVACCRVPALSLHAVSRGGSVVSPALRQSRFAHRVLTAAVCVACVLCAQVFIYIQFTGPDCEEDPEKLPQHLK